MQVAPSKWTCQEEERHTDRETDRQTCTQSRPSAEGSGGSASPAGLESQVQTKPVEPTETPAPSRVSILSLFILRACFWRPSFFQSQKQTREPSASPGRVQDGPWQLQCGWLGSPIHSGSGQEATVPAGGSCRSPPRPRPTPPGPAPHPHCGLPATGNRRPWPGRCLPALGREQSWPLGEPSRNDYNFHQPRSAAKTDDTRHMARLGNRAT